MALVALLLITGCQTPSEVAVTEDISAETATDAEATKAAVDPQSLTPVKFTLFLAAARGGCAHDPSNRTGLFC